MALFCAIILGSAIDVTVLNECNRSLEPENVGLEEDFELGLLRLQDNS